jgi:hypothetical protein
VVNERLEFVWIIVKETMPRRVIAPSTIIKMEPEDLLVALVFIAEKILQNLFSYLEFHYQDACGQL